MSGLDDKAVESVIESLKHMRNNLKEDSVFASEDNEEDI